MEDEIKWECPRCEKLNKAEWAEAMVNYQKCRHCGVTCDVEIVVTVEGVTVIE